MVRTNQLITGNEIVKSPETSPQTYILINLLICFLLFFSPFLSCFVSIESIFVRVFDGHEQSPHFTTINLSFHAKLETIVTEHPNENILIIFFFFDGC